MDKIIIWGGTGQAIVLEELLSEYPIEISAIFENNIFIKTPIKNVPIYYGKEGLITWVNKTKDIHKYKYLVAIGGNKGRVRQEIGKVLENIGLKPYTAIHKTAFIANSTLIGEGTQILANTSICAKVQIGKCCIINTSAIIDHECILSDNVHIGPGATLTGCVKINEGAFVGANSTILPRIEIGKYSIIGAGSVVTKNIPAYSIAFGNPAKIVKTIIQNSNNESIFT